MNRFNVGFPGGISWSQASGWSAFDGGPGGATAPTNGDSAILDRSGVVNFNVNIAGSGLSNLSLGAGGGVSLNQSANTLTTTQFDIGVGAGYSGQYQLTNGTLNITGTSPTALRVGDGAPNASGAIILGQLGQPVGPVSVSVVGGVVVGGTGSGNIQQNGPTTFNAGSIVLGRDANSTGIFTLDADHIVYGTITTASDFIVGESGTGEVDSYGMIHVQSAGRLVLGDQAGAKGTVHLSGGFAHLDNTMTVGNAGNGTLIIAQEPIPGDPLPATEVDAGGGGVIVGNIATGNGTIVMSGGRFNVGSSSSPAPLFIGNGAGAKGYFNLSSALSSSTLSVSSSMMIGNFGAGTFTQSAGTATVGLASTPALLAVGGSAGGAGSYLFNGGALTVYGNEYVGMGGSVGTFNQTGGSNHIVGSNASAGNLIVGNSGQPAITSRYFLRTGTSLAVDGQETIGLNGKGVFTQSGGTHDVGTVTSPGVLILGSGASGAGTYLLSQTGTLTVHGDEFIGGVDSTIGSFSQSGGTHIITNTLHIAPNGHYSLSGGSMSFGSLDIVSGGQLTLANTDLSVNAPITIAGSGSNATGAILNSAGNNDISGTGNITLLGDAAITAAAGTQLTISKTIDKNGHNLTIGGAGNIVDDAANGITGVADVFITGPGTTTYDSPNTYSGPTNVSGGVLVLNNTGSGFSVPHDLIIQNGGSVVAAASNQVAPTANVTLQAGGSLAVNPGVSLGGNFEWDGGELSYDSLLIGPGGPLTDNVTLTGQQHLNTTNDLTIDSGGNLINEATTSVGGTAYIGKDGVGSLFQSGGTTTSGFIALGYNTTGKGSYELSGGTLNLTGSSFGGSLIVGQSGAGSIQIDGNARVTTAGNVSLAYNSNTSANVVVNGGSITLGSAPGVGELYVARGPGSTAEFDFRSLNGDATLTVNSNVYVGYGGTGTFIQGSGQVSLIGNSGNSGYLQIGVLDGSHGQYTIGAGTLNVSGGDIDVGGDAGTPHGQGTFTAVHSDTRVNIGQVLRIWNTGTVIIQGAGVHVGVDTSIYGRLDISDGTLDTPGAANGLGLNTQAGGTFNVSGNATVNIGDCYNYGRIEQSGGTITINGFIAGDGVFHQTGGTAIYSNGSAIDTQDVAIAAGSIIDNGTLTVGKSDTSPGILNVSGGSVTVHGTLGVGNTGTRASGNGEGHVHISGGTLSADTVILGSNTGGSADVTISGGKMHVNHLLSVAPSGSFSITDTGQLDLNGEAIIDYPNASPLATIQAYLRSGYANGAWNGNGINSSTAADDASTEHRKALAYKDEPWESGGEMIIEMRYSGDANLDGAVNTLDFNALATNYGGSAKVWLQGDFTYDGSITSSDFDELAMNFGEVMSDSASMATPATALGVLVPEPTMLGLLIALPTIGIRRRRR